MPTPSVPRGGTPTGWLGAGVLGRDQLMAIRDLDRRRIERGRTEYCDRVPQRVRHQLRKGFRSVGRAVVPFESRPDWKNPKESMEHPVAKFRYNATRELWPLYSQFCDLKWHS